MLIHCSNRKCNTTTEHKLKSDTMEVICMKCAEINDTVTDFTKNAMKGSGDLYKQASKKAFMYGCKKCNTNREVFVKGNKAYCKNCTTEVYVPPTSIEAIKLLSDKFKDIDGDDEPAKTPAKAEVKAGKIKRVKKADQDETE